MYVYKLYFILSGKTQEFKVGGVIAGGTYYSKDDSTWEI
jgi:hypothetical protein